MTVYGFRGHGSGDTTVLGTPYLVLGTPYLSLTLPRKFRGHHTDLPTLPAGMAMGASRAHSQRHPDRRGAVREALPRRMSFVNIETGEVGVVCEFRGRASDQAGCDSPRVVVPKVGLEPTPSCEDRILSPARLPFRHFGSGYRFSIVPKSAMAVNPAPVGTAEPEPERWPGYGGDLQLWLAQSRSISIARAMITPATARPFSDPREATGTSARTIAEQLSLRSCRPILRLASRIGVRTSPRRP